MIERFKISKKTHHQDAMTTTQSSKHLEAIETALEGVSAMDIAEIKEALAEAPPYFQVRGLITPVIEHGVKTLAPSKLEVLRQRTVDFPGVTPFAFGPIHDLLSRLAIASALSMSHRPLWEACNGFVRLQIGKLNTLPTFLSVLRACEGEWQVFMKLLVNSHALVYNVGQADIEVIHGRVILHYSDMPARALSYWGVGYLEGIFDTFKVEGRVYAERHDQRALSLIMEEG